MVNASVQSSSNINVGRVSADFLASRRTLLADLAVFALALTLRLWFCLASNVPNVSLAADASEYLRYAQGLNTVLHLPVQFWLDTVSCAFVHTPTTTITPGLSQLHEMSRSGYIFPMFLWFTFALAGMAPDSAHWQIPIMAQCIVSSIGCVVVGKIGQNLWDEKTGLTAAVLAAIYPGFIVNCARLYSDPFAEILSCIALLISTDILVKRKSNIWVCLALGAVITALSMTRSVLLVTLPLFILPLFWLERQASLKAIAAVVAGMAVVIFPWVLLQKAVLGTVSLMVDRGGRYNLFVGLNTDSQGWLSFPAPRLDNIESVAPLKIIINAIKKSPDAFLKLLLDKPARFLATPCNDFKAPLGVISCWMQTVIHQVILALASLGLVTSLFETSAYRDRQKEKARLLLLTFFVFHAPYLLFITMSRYALTAIPVIILFSAAGVTILSGAIKARQSRQASTYGIVAIVSIFALLLFVQGDCADYLLTKYPAMPLWFAFAIQGAIRGTPFAIAICATLRLALHQDLPSKQVKMLAFFIAVLVLPELALPLRAYKRYGEYPIAFNQPGQRVLECIPLSEKQERLLKQGVTYVMVNIENGEHLRDDIAVSINGVTLAGPFIPAMSLAQSLPSIVMTSSSELKLEAEWILTDMLYGFGNLSLLKLRDTYLIPITPAELNQALQRDRHLLALRVEKLNDAPNILYSGHFVKSVTAKTGCLMLPSVSMFSWEKGSYGMERVGTMNDLALDQKIIVQRMEGRYPNLHDTFLRLLVAESGGDQPQNSHYILPSDAWKSPKSGELTQIIDVCSPRKSASSVQVIRFTGILNGSLQHHKNARIEIAAIYDQPDGSEVLQQSSWLPKQLVLADKSINMDYTSPLCLSKTNHLKKVSVKFLNLDATMVPPRNCEVQIVELPTNPVISSHQIF
ncbi:MAG TPA: hypothetical protein V6C86_20460 [Oculatellaceae cyanobacterium]